MYRLPFLTLILSVSLFSIAAYRYFCVEARDVVTVGTKPMIVGEFSQGVPVTQHFAFPREGLRWITIPIWSERPLTLDVELELRRATPSDTELITTVRRSLSQPAGEAWHTFDVTAVPRSRDQVFAARVRLRAVAGSSPSTAGSFGLLAWADDTLTSARLFVGDVERWGDLWFSAQAEPATRLARMLQALDAQLPGDYSPGRTVWMLLLGTYGALTLAVAFAAIASTSRQSDSGAPRFGVPSSRYGSARGFLLAGGTAALAVSVLGARERVVIDLLGTIDAATVEAARELHTTVVEVEESINGVSSRAIFAHAPSRVTWLVALPQGRPVLRTAIALRWIVWQFHTDGVTFNVYVEDGSGRTLLYSRSINPAQRFDDRAWLPVDVDLSGYAGRSIRLTLETSPGPAGDSSFDWAIWAHPRIIE